MRSPTRGPDGKRLAAVGALSGVLVIGLFALAVWVRETRDWPTARSDDVLLVGVLVIGLIPIGLVLIDALIRRGGAVTFQGFTIDLAAASRPAVAFSINTNVGVTGETLADNSSEEILDVLERAAASEIAVVDLKDGHAWWETRLLILAAGAVRTGRPRALVFVAARAGQSQSFLGWVTPKSLLDALLDPPNPRHVLYLKSYGLALEAAAQWQQEMDKLRASPPGTAPTTPPGLPGYPWNEMWIAWRAGKPNPFASEQFLAVALGNELEETWRAVPWPGPDASPTEQFPRAVTITEETVRTQFGAQLQCTSLDASAASDTHQVEVFLEDSSDFAAITREGAYVGLAPRSALLDDLVQQLLLNSLRESR